MVKEFVSIERGEYNRLKDNPTSNVSSENEIVSDLYCKEKIVWWNYFSCDKKFKFRVGDHVRLSLRKRLFKKGYKMNWTEEIFQITRQLSRTLVVYTVQDLLERPIEGAFHEEELPKVKRPDIFRIEKVLKKRTKNKKT